MPALAPVCGGTERTREARRRLAALVLGTLAVGGVGPAGAAEDMFDGTWHFSATPYLWLPDVNATLNYPLGRSGSISVDATPGGYLQYLDLAAMFTGEARKGEWSVFTDYIYLHFSADRSPVRFVTDPTGNTAVPVSIAGSSNLISNVWTLAGSYTAWRGESAFVEHEDQFPVLGLLDIHFDRIRTHGECGLESRNRVLRPPDNGAAVSDGQHVFAKRVTNTIVQRMMFALRTWGNRQVPGHQATLNCIDDDADDAANTLRARRSARNIGRHPQTYKHYPQR